MSKSLPIFNPPPEEPWWKDGLNFACTGCGKCCTGFSGFVWVNEEEITKIAAFLKISVSEFTKKYLRKKEGRWSLVEKRPSYDCIFLKDKKYCQIYEVRPLQCQTYPWWPMNLQSKESWENTKQFCEGIQEDAPKVPKEIIEKALQDEPFPL